MWIHCTNQQAPLIDTESDSTCISILLLQPCTQKYVLKILRISSRVLEIRQRSSRRFLCAYMLPIRDIWAAFSVLLYFTIFFNNVAFRQMQCLRCSFRVRCCHRYMADYSLDGETVDTELCECRSWGSEGRCKRPSGVRGGAPEQNNM